MLSDLQKRTAEALVNVFETGVATGDYACVTRLRGDPGHLTYGRSQTTLASGNLYRLLKAYADAPGARLAEGIRPYLPRLQACDVSLDGDQGLIDVLRQAGDDKAMRQVQDAFFDRDFWDPATARARCLGVVTALGCAVVYDSTVQGSFEAIRERTDAELGCEGAGPAGEQAWVAAYVALRRDWLAGNPNKLLRRTAYRAEALQGLVNAGNWALALPLTVRGVVIDEDLLAGQSAPVCANRSLMLMSPALQGEDVAALQRALVAQGETLSCDGVFGDATDRCLRAFQARHDMVADGVAGPVTQAALELG